MSAQVEQIPFRMTERYLGILPNLHRYLIEQLEEKNASVETWPARKLLEFVRENVQRHVSQKRLPLNHLESEMLAHDAVSELIGFGPLQTLVDDDEVDDIVVNGPARIFVERRGQMSTAPVRFVDNSHVVRIIQRILAPLGRRIDESTPMVDARLPDGSRVNAVIPPIALDGPSISIRKFRKSPLTAADLLEKGSLNQPILDFLKHAVNSRHSTMVLGGTGSGKTTFLNLISQWIPTSERIITIEDAAELRLHHEHVVRLETRPENLEGKNRVSARDLVRNALRMRPDRIIVGEIRGDEVMDVLQAMNTGHEGSMSTIHANSPHDGLHRLQLLAGFAGFGGSENMLLQQIASALDLMVHVSRLPSGKRRVMSVVRVKDIQDGQLQLQQLFGYDAASDSHFACGEAA